MSLATSLASHQRLTENGHLEWIDWPFPHPLDIYIRIIAITVDRFGTVLYPFEYPRHSTMIMIIIFAVGSLYGAATSLLLVANSIGCYNVDKYDQICNFQINCSEIWCYVLVLLEVSFGIVVPLILNIMMFYKAKKLRSTIHVGTIVMVGPGVIGYTVWPNP